MEIVLRAVLEVGQVLDLEIVDVERHAEIGGLDSHDIVPSAQSRRMTMAEPVPGMAQPRLAVTSQFFTCRQPPSR